MTIATELGGKLNPEPQEKPQILLPLNKYVIVEKQEKEEQNSKFIIPDDNSREPITSGKVLELEKSDDQNLKAGYIVFFETYAAKEIEYNDKTLLLVPYEKIIAFISN